MRRKKYQLVTKFNVENSVLNYYLKEKRIRILFIVQTILFLSISSMYCDCLTRGYVTTVRFFFCFSVEFVLNKLSFAKIDENVRKLKIDYSIVSNARLETTKL